MESTSAVTCRKLGHSLARRGDWAPALECYRQAANLEPASAETWFEWGTVLYLAGEAEKAHGAFAKALSLSVDLPKRRRAEYWFHFGVAAMHRGETEQAFAAYDQAVRLDPRHARARNSIGLLHQARGRPDDAERSYRAALRADPQFVQARFNRAVLLEESDRPAEALDEYERVVRANPRHLDAMIHQANTLTALGRSAEAVSVLERALAIDPANPQARWARSLGALRVGDWETGWREHEWRFRQPDHPRRAFTEPRWGGEPLEGRRILLWAEQGFGDTIQFLRYAPLAADRGGVVVVECPGPLVSLARSVAGVTQVVAAGAPLPPFDLQLPLMSLPGVFGSTVDSVPARVPYLAAEPSDWLRLLVPRDGAVRRVGLVWSGDPCHRDDRHRSIDPALLIPFGGVTGVQFIGVQYGADQLPPGLDGVSLGGRVTDFADTAAIIAGLDLVISVDTAVAHLAGALGAPLWLLAPFAADWRWLEGRSDSPWYPTMRIYRQPARNDWAAVIERLRADLVALVSAPDSITGGSAE